MAVEATRWEDGLVILDAIRQRMDEKSSPRWIPEWARTLGAEHRANRRFQERIAEGRDGSDEDAYGDDARWNAGRRIRNTDAEIDPEVRRVMVTFSAARGRGENVALADVTCIVCKQFTETKCPTCSRALHARSCPKRHECVAGGGAA